MFIMIDLYKKHYFQCFSTTTGENALMLHLLLNIFVSFWISTIFVVAMTTGENSRQYIYFNDVNFFAGAGKNNCNRVSTTKFRCSA